MPLSSRKSYPCFTNYESKFCKFCDPIPETQEYPRFNLLLIFCPLSDPVKRWYETLFKITRPYPRVNGLKTIPFPVAYPFSQYMGVPPRGDSLEDHALRPVISPLDIFSRVSLRINSAHNLMYDVTPLKQSTKNVVR